MLSCPDVCDEVIDRLRKLGFVFDESEDHQPIFDALAKVQFSLTEEGELDGDHGGRSSCP